MTMQTYDHGLDTDSRTETRKSRAAKKLTESQKSVSILSSGELRLDSREFAVFERCMKNPKKPTKALLKGAELLRTLYGQKL